MTSRRSSVTGGAFPPSSCQCLFRRRSDWSPANTECERAFRLALRLNAGTSALKRGRSKTPLFPWLMLRILMSSTDIQREPTFHSRYVKKPHRQYCSSHWWDLWGSPSVFSSYLRPIRWKSSNPIFFKFSPEGLFRKKKWKKRPLFFSAYVEVDDNDELNKFLEKRPTNSQPFSRKSKISDFHVVFILLENASRWLRWTFLWILLRSMRKPMRPLPYLQRIRRKSSETGRIGFFFSSFFTEEVLLLLTLSPFFSETRGDSRESPWVLGK